MKGKETNSITTIKKGTLPNEGEPECEGAWAVFREGVNTGRAEDCHLERKGLLFWLSIAQLEDGRVWGPHNGISLLI